MKELKYPKKFKTEDDLKKWLDENEIEYEWCHVYINGDWEYQDEQEFWHLYRDGMELTKGIKIKWVFSDNNGDWRYQDEQEFWHLYRDGVELTAGVKAKWVYSYENGHWRYKDEQNQWYEFDKNNNKIK